jgi:nuclear GTP-binding protein
MASEPALSSLAQLAASASANDLVPALSESTSAATKTKEQLRRHYVRMPHKVVDESDVVLLVLDARDPAGCRSRLVEEEVRRREAEGKRLVFVLNKIGTCAPP